MRKKNKEIASMGGEREKEEATFSSFFLVLVFPSLHA